VPSFLPVPVDGREASGHGEAARLYQVQIDGSEVSSHDEIVLVRAKKEAPARRPAAHVDFVPRDETVAVQGIQ
jgi:hypothetical protein